MWIKNGMSHYQLLFNFGLEESLLFVLNSTATLTLTDQQRQNTRPRLFKCCIALAQLVSLILIRWIVIYPVDRAIQRLNNWGQYYTGKRMK